MNNSINDFLSELGLTAEEINIYVSLVKKGPLTILELARVTNINRTRIYRLLEKLNKTGIVEDILDENRHLAKAADSHTIEMLIRKQETKAFFLRNTFPEVKKHFTKIQTDNQHTKVLVYKGQEGIKQMIWNTLRADKELFGYSSCEIEGIIGKTLAGQWQDEWIRKKLIFKELYSDIFIASLNENNKERIDQQKNPFFESRYISSSVFDISHQLDIYNGVVAYYYWSEKELFGVEIYSQVFADMQKQLFTLVWNLASEEKG